MSNGIIYKIENTKNSKCYIGSTLNFKHRVFCHKNNLLKKKHINKKLQFAWNKYGEECFLFTVIEEVQSPSLLIEREQFYIEFYKAVEDGYNICPVAGSPGTGISPSVETRKKLSDAMKGRYFSPATREKISVSKRGRPRSEETKRKLAIASTGKKQSPETIKKRITALSGLKRSKEFCQLMSELNKGRIISQAQREKIKRSWKIRHFKANCLSMGVAA